MRTSFILFLCFSFSIQLFAESWQQAVDYKIDYHLNVKTHLFKGSESLQYTNNSPDTLKRLFFHLYFNAFQPNSMMDIRSRNISDPDKRVMDRIQNLSTEEEGQIHVSSLKVNGLLTEIIEEETILIVQLKTPVLPSSTVQIDLEFNGQVPLQIRRCGRDNKEGIAYSMAQWYPKIAEYDLEGWHSNPYIGREFYGVWGNFEVTLTLDSSYTIGGTGLLQNPEEIGHRYVQDTTVNRKKDAELCWKFKAENVHDFVWAADPDYIHETHQVPEGPLVHFFYQSNDSSNTQQKWQELPTYVDQIFTYANTYFGKYPYPVYSIIQGGDGGMEYPMATLITGKREMESLVSVIIHESMHSWYQGVLATNESLYPWMDEGFTSYASNRIHKYIYYPDSIMNEHKPSYDGYYNLVKKRGTEEPMSTHADHYNTNYAYSQAVYGKGAVFLAQLGYVVGNDVLDRALLKYFDQWKFKHPTPTDLKRIVEKESDMELDWYFEYFVETTKSIDYEVAYLTKTTQGCQISLKRNGRMIMPIEVTVEYVDESKEHLYIPLEIMRGEKSFRNEKVHLLADWKWPQLTYAINLEKEVSTVKKITIDSSGLLANTSERKVMEIPKNFNWKRETLYSGNHTIK